MRIDTEARAFSFHRRCIEPTGSVDLTEMPVGRWPHNQNDRLAAVSGNPIRCFDQAVIAAPFRASYASPADPKRRGRWRRAGMQQLASAALANAKPRDIARGSW